MLDQQVVNLANDRIRLEIDGHRRKFHEDVKRAEREVAAREPFRPGARFEKVGSLGVDAVRDRGQIIWQTLFRFVTLSGVTWYEGLTEDLKRVVADRLSESVGDIKGYADKVEREMREPRLLTLVSHLRTKIEDARTTTLKTMNSEIDLFVISLKNGAQAPKNQPAQTVFNISSPVGAIQTGANAIAHVSQAIDPATRDKLLGVLIDLGQRLENIDALPGHPKHEIAELIKDSETEIRKDTPNWTKIRNFLSSIATSIQTVAALKPAYEGLKEILGYLGISVS